MAAAGAGTCLLGLNLFADSAGMLELCWEIALPHSTGPHSEARTDQKTGLRVAAEQEDSKETRDTENLESPTLPLPNKTKRSRDLQGRKAHGRGKVTPDEE